MATDLLARGGIPLDTPTLDFIVHHVFLPPRLPQEVDTDGQHLLAMVQVLRDSVSDFMAVERRSSPSVQPALDMLDQFLGTNPGPGVSKTNTAHRDMLRSVISDLKDGDVALLHLRDQNSGLLLTSRQDNILFETFELLAPNQNVMSCEGSLLREFPDRAVTVPLGKLRDAALLDVLVDAIQELEFKVAPGARRKVTKAKTVQLEQRDTLSSALTTGLLTDVLVGLGQEVHPERITKRSREQVCYDNAFLPFHRSATWLLLRVALRLVLDRRAAMHGETSWYKPLMAHHHARILDLARRASQPLIPSDKLFSMEAKLVRRIIKLDPAGDVCSGWLRGAQETIRRVKATLEGRWATELDKDNQSPPLDKLSQLSFLQDSELKLSSLLAHLSWIESRHAGQRELMEAYYMRASAAYGGIPGALSIMYMVIVELWITMDKIAGREIPLLLDYDPGFPSDAFHSLLLEREEEMRRLHAVENYLSFRRARAPNSYRSAFAGFGCDDSFAVRFYHTSVEHHRLRREIEDWGAETKAEKLEEYEKMRAKYNSLAATYNATSCEYYWNHQWQEETHSSGCQRCRLEREMENLNIDVFEWPLPDDPSHAKAAVLEISVPQLAVLWRDVTWRLVTEVFCEKEKGDRCKAGQESLYFAAERRGMGLFLQNKSHLHPASTVKPMEVAHYRTKHILDATAENVCACLEAGPQPDSGSGGRAASIWREAHLDTQKESFMNQILPSLRDALLRVRESWQNNISLCILTCLATRLLALSPSADIASALLEYLGQLRDVSITWTRLLRDKLDKSDNTLDRQRWIDRLLVAALTCGTTFSMGGAHLGAVLNDPDNLSRLVKSAVLARNHLPPSGRPADTIALQLMQRWHAVMYRARHLVAREVIDRGNPGLDRAIKHLWADYSPTPTAGWARLDQNAQSHILTRRSGGGSVTFNLITGHFFLNGYLLSKLPSSYQKHPTFRQLFGEQILDVGPSRVPGMEFSASRDQNGWILHFAMKDSRLVVHAVRQRSQGHSGAHDVGVQDGSRLDDSWEYIPREHLTNDLPNSFVNDYSHWLHLATSRVEFRPIGRRWESATESWCLARENHKHILRKGSRAVMDPSSPTAQLSHLILGAIETPGNINVILDCDDNSLALELPRLSLSFQAQQGKNTVQSKNYSGMQIDETQGIGSLVGLVDKLVLKPEHGPGFKTVLVPRGQVSSHLAEASSHVKVSIHRGDHKRVRHDAFLVNDKLGCLADTGSLQSKLYLCWLHALTSHCLPDPLTSRTGTEEALRVLQGAAVRSYPTLDDDSLALLGQIARLSPLRTYYPLHLQEMEQTAWSNALPPLSQHDDFWPLATCIFDDYKKSGKLFQPESWNAKADNTSASMDVLSEKRPSNLAQRARIRNAIFRVSEFGAEGHTTAEDTWYHPRDRAAAGGQGSEPRVSQLVRCMDTGAERLIWKPCSDMSSRIEAVNGSKFTGNPVVTIGFHLDNLRVPTKALGGLWCGLHRALVAETNKYRKMLFLSSLLYAEGSDPQVVQALMALGSISVFAQADMLPPPDAAFDLDIKHATLRGKLFKVTNDGKKDHEECPEYRWTKHRYESVREFESRRKQGWVSNSYTAVKEFVDELETKVRRSWTVYAPTSSSYRSYLHIDRIMLKVWDLVETARRSEAFCDYLSLLSRKLSEVGIWKSREPVLVSVRSSDRPYSIPGLVSAASLFSRPAPYSDRPLPDTFPTMRTEIREPEKEHARLSALVDELKGVENLQGHQVSYIAKLRHSIASPAAPQPDTIVPEGAPLEKLQKAQERYDSIRRSVEIALTGTSIAHQVCNDAGIYPRISPIFLLQRLTRVVWTQLSQPWRRCLVDLSLSLVHLQRAERLHGHYSGLPERRGDLQRELSNPGDHENPEWDPLEYPESLLLEIEQGIMIRAVQNKIAAAMRSPPGMKNAVMQLNMGEGKSSVIVPIVAAALADGERLVRIVVAKPQSNQMTHMLIGKLGGLLNRRVFYLPLSRSIQLSLDGVTVVREIVERCRTEGGVLLVQPEHLLSFKLMGIDKSWAARDEKTNDGGALGESITGLYQHFESVSRDIVDESDENFSVKFELIYTMGAQEAVEMSPDRWTLIQQLLDMTEAVVRRLMAAENAHTRVVEGLVFEDHGAGRVPVIRILGESAGQHLIAELAATVCRCGLRGFPVHHQTESMRQAVRNYISVDQAAPNDITLVEEAGTGLFSSPTAKNVLLLLRGLLAKGVILFALSQKRFRVNYGLAPGRRPQTMLAVPYRAKDMPSPRSEFSHPDVVIVLTCLSYYYSGLSDEQLYTCLELLNDSDQAEQEYGRWASKSPDLPPSFQHFSSINIEDKPQCESIVFPALRYARPAVDFYLAYVVFLKEMKQFPLKLSSSGWDLAKPKKHPMTGFSGTNDSKGVLPLSVAALDLQPHTNAAVLSTILRDENTVLEVGTEKGSRLSALSEEMLLGSLALSEPSMRVILDVGAQIIESSNLQMAKRLLLASVPARSADAVIFFNDQDELSDTLVQACMRMRKLGRGQSVSFVVSPEMQKRIRAVRSVARERPLGVADVIAWAISETWDQTVRSVPLWAVQGIRHIRQETIWERVEERGVFSSSDAQEYLEPEAMCLEQRYRPRSAPTAGETEIAALMANLDLGFRADPDKTAKQCAQKSAIREKLAAFTHATRTSTASSTLQEEQERELAPEIEEERHVARPPPRTALPHKLDWRLVQFVRTGRAEMAGAAFSQAFLVMLTTSAASLFPPGLAAFPGHLLVTEDFARTVEETGPLYRSDSYQRGVQWVLARSARTRDEETSPGPAGMVLVSQWEASRLKGVIEKLQQKLESKAAASEAVLPVTLHAYLARPSLTFSSMEHLKTYTIPAVAADWEAPQDLVMQLNLFAGQLYLRSYDEYKRMCRYLGLVYTKNEDQDTAVSPDGFVGKKKYPECEFESSPVAFLAKVYEIRGDCVGGIEKTHMGKILAGEILTEKDF
ncbi:hypothetical protein B0T24DRAFT_577590 [Lasiosphaeria ovina]|uniref:ubiquitinyl hydrolase 1 n=1 Tax=Lasiosphaeria ovina TaxID=92902 RepID=A0AAE0N8A8_9PEZI|nr:hypothetical protein B0T24DRAFT_577590 [Lasiosphaeria ovina]